VSPDTEYIDDAEECFQARAVSKQTRDRPYGGCASFTDSCTTAASSGCIGGDWRGLSASTPGGPPNTPARRVHGGADPQRAESACTDRCVSFTGMMEERRTSTEAVPSFDASAGSTACSSTARPRTFESEYRSESQVLGTGASGSVRVAFCKRTGEKMAVKRYNKATMSQKELRNMRREVGIHQSLSHRSIVRIADVFETDREMIIVMECLEGGELFDLVYKSKQLSEKETARIATDILLGLEHLHSQRICHRDIKLENLVFARAAGVDVKLIDFGFAANLDAGEELSVCGTVQYVAPEVIANSAWDERCDLWSLGSVVYTMLTGARLFSGGESEVIRKNRKGLIDWSRRFERLSPLAQDFVKRLLSTDPAGRLTAAGALAHPWLKEVASQEAATSAKPACKASCVLERKVANSPSKKAAEWGPSGAASAVVAAANMAKEAATLMAADASAAWQTAGNYVDEQKKVGSAGVGAVQDWAKSTLTVVGAMRPYAYDVAYGAL